MKSLTSIVIVSLVLFAACVATAPTTKIRYVQTKTGLPVTIVNGHPVLPERGTSIDPGQITQITSLLGGCGGTSSATGIFDGSGVFHIFGSIGIPPEPTQANPIDICKPLLTTQQAATLQIMFNNFPEVLTDGIHALTGTYGPSCPILGLCPLESNYASGTITPMQFAQGIYNFFCAKWLQNLNGKKDTATAQLVAAGLPNPPPAAAYVQTPGL